MRKPPQVLLLFAVSIFLIADVLPAGETYRWRDENGVLHFSDSPPESAVDIDVHGAIDGTEAGRETSVPRPAADVPATGGVFWRIENADAPPSYLLGTIHSTDPRVVKLPSHVTRAFEASDALVMEMDLTQDSVLQFGTAMISTDGSDLKDLLGARDFSRVETALTDYPFPEAVLRKLKPWAVMALISQPKPESGLFMDMVLYQQALSTSKRIFGLETAEEQIAVFNDMSLADQVALLRASLAQVEQMPRMHAKLIETYLTGDLAAIEALSNKMAQSYDKGLANRFLFRLNEARNDRMVVRMLPYIESGRAFIAVGALHLAGSNGIVAQLESHGYTMSPVDP